MNLQDFKSRPEVTDAIAASVEVALKQIGEDPKREGLVKTPHRTTIPTILPHFLQIKNLGAVICYHSFATHSLYLTTIV